MEERDTLYIDGAWVAPTGAAVIDVVNPATELVIGRVPSGTPQDVDRAVRAAHAALPGWSGTSVPERVALLRRVAAGLQDRMVEIAQVITAEVGMPFNLSLAMQAGVPPLLMETMAGVAETFAFEERIGDSLLIREPVGVVGAITPWNFPLQDIAVKVASALAAGCTVVLKPSEVAPLNAFRLAEVIHELGLPRGVFNLVTGLGYVAGEALAAHPGVSMVSFTGSTRSGRRVAELAARTVKRVSLELGGKSPSIVLDDADLDWAVTDGVSKCFLNSGQTCTALSRLLVPRAWLAEAESIATRAAEEFVVGDPCGEDTSMGPLASAEQREWVLGHIRGGLDDGARLLTGGLSRPEGLDRGYFVRPTVFSDVSSGMAIAQEEIFGPLLSIVSYEGEAEAVAIANDTVYGLTASVWSGDPERAVRVARQLRSGQVEINGGNFDLAAPFGGCKQSGYGREMGRFGLEEFLEVKSLQLPS